MKLSLLSRAKIFCVIGLSLNPLASSAGDPVIRPSSAVLHSSNISFQFDAEGGRPGRFRLEATTHIGEAVSWETVTNASISESVSGLYEVWAPLATPQTTRFYRIAALNPPASLFINEVMSKNDSTIADASGDYWDWIELYNPNDALVDLDGYGLTDDASRPHRWRFPAVAIQPGSFLMIFASGLDRAQTNQQLHANFALKSGGEPLYLTGPDQSIVDFIELPSLQADQSVGRLPDGGAELQLYAKAQSTPGAANSGTPSGPLIPQPIFSATQRFFPEGTVLNLGFEAPGSGHVIRYSRNGGMVTSNSLLYTSSIVLTQTTVIRAATFTSEGASAETIGTFFIGVDHDLPIISMASQPGYFEFRNGYLYGMGSNVLNAAGDVLQNFPYTGSHAWKDREVEASLEFYEPDQTLGFQQKAGLKIFGGYGSRGYPQKSFALFARRIYGDGKINHRIFPDKAIDEFESIVLRNSGNDNQSSQQTPARPPITEFGGALSYGSYFVNSSFTMMRDAMMQRLLKDVDLDTQGYRPAVLYINGEYWGIYNIREKINEDYVVSNHGVEKGQIDLIEGYSDANAGDNVVNQTMRNFINNNSMANAANYAEVETKYLEIDNFIDYHLAVIYFQNFDIGNIKSWRPRVPNGKFRWIVYDQDYGFNLWKPEIYIPAMARDYSSYDNMFQFYTAGTGTSTAWPNGGGRTLLLRRLLANSTFKERFIKRCADLLNGPFREDRVVNTIDEMAEVIRPEIPRHLQRWSWSELRDRGFDRPHKIEYQPFTQATWEANLDVLRDFAQQRPAKLRQDCIQHFGLTSGTAVVTVNVHPVDAGRVQLNTLHFGSFPTSGIYFRAYPLKVLAIPKPGFRFAGWRSESATNNSPQWDMPLNAANFNLVADFEPIVQEPPLEPSVIVTEVHYHPAALQDSGDWIELHNRSAQPVNLSGWNFRDDNDDHDFLLPQVILEPGAFLVLSQDREKFRTVYPTVTNCLGDFVFGLGNGGDTLRLFDAIGNVMLNLTYDDQLPWPTEPDGTGHTLQLINPNSFSTNAAAWTGSPALGGTPGGPSPGE